jgi:hypothetical protein
MKKILFICGSLNQTTMMHQISQHLDDKYECSFSPYYADDLVDFAARSGWLDATVLGGKHLQNTLDYLQENNLMMDWRGEQQDYDLVFTGSDLIVPKNIRGKRMILVQEGITEPETWLYHLVKWLKLPRYLANTATTGLSDQYDIFCVASHGYRDLFIRKGVKRDKMIVTGIPNFDNVRQYRKNDFLLKDFVLVATSPLRENFRYDNRKSFLRQCYELAAGRQLIFKLHPLENVKRATHEIKKYCPGALIFYEGIVEHMIANATTVVTQHSTCTFTALGLGKEVYSYLDLDELRVLMPIQNSGTSAGRIASIGQKLIQTPLHIIKAIRRGIRARPRWETDR